MNAVQPGDFACVHVKGDVGTLISVGEYLNGDGFSYYDHALIYLGEGHVIGAQPGGARIDPIGLDQLSLTNRNYLWSTGKIPLTDSQRRLIVAGAVKCKGVPYSPADYFALAAHRLHIPAPNLEDFIADNGHMICSQLVDWVYMNAGVHLFADGRWPGYVTPQALANLLEHHA
jgi:hypothetical protein